MNKIGFNKNIESLPSFDKFQSIVNQRVMFLKFFNQEVSCKLKFSKEEFKACRKQSLFNIFIKKIYSHLLYTDNSTNSFKLDIEKSIKINKFLKKTNKENDFKFKNFSFSNKNRVDINIAVSLIDILEESGCSLYLDGNKIFKNFVSNKIIKNNESKKIDVNSDSIDIVSEENSFRTKIFTFWEFINSKSLQIDEHIQKAISCINSSDFKQIYLVYPKNENFDKHIRIRTEGITCSEYEIKLIPYSLRSTLR
ncbi:hypothetical protein [Arcobacter sp. LA11]|uniref:hypothetical protein n=1 Tax=Arcobacter sp. LA11 TaxID=1898176 RepID=UPI000933E3C1|nr:hypothetical protein [Arcobacter sp. LA11]